MNRSIIAFAAALACAAASFAETYFVATVTDPVGGKTFSVVSKDEARELQQDIKRKNALMQKVLAEIKADFAKNPAAHSGEKYFGDKLKPMAVKLSQQQFTDMAKAQEFADKMQEREENKDDDSGKKKKKLSDSQKMRAIKEAERDFAIKTFGEEVVKMIEEKLEAMAAEAAK